MKCGTIYSILHTAGDNVYIDKIKQASNVGDEFVVRVPLEIGSVIRKSAQQKGISYSLFLCEMIEYALRDSHNGRKIQPPND